MRHSRRRRSLRRQQGREFRVGYHFHGENCLSALNFIAVGEHRVRDAPAIQKSAVAAFAILDAAATRPALDGKVHAGHERVVRQRKLRAPRRSPECDRLPRNNSYFFAGKRPCVNFQ